MDFAQLSTITDATILRGMVVEKLSEIALQSQQLSAHAKTLAERDAVIAERDVLITSNEALIAQISEYDAAIAKSEAVLARRDESIRTRDIHIEALTHEVARLRRMQFAAKSERMDPEQRALFDDTMAADLAAAEAALEALKTLTTETPPTTPRVAPKRRPLPPELPRVTTVHAPDCSCCSQCGGELVQMGEHVRERLACKPIEFFVRREVYPQLACRPCERIEAVPVAPAILDRSQADPSLLAQVVIAKYTDHLPLYRQEAIYARSGVELAPSTLGEWIGAVGVALQPLVGALRRELLTHEILHADETPVEQLDPGAGKTKRAYLFAYRSATAPLVVFDYCSSRSGQNAQRFLDDWRGHLMVDDFAGYKALFAKGVTELACWAHARRKFVDLDKASGSLIAKEAIQRIAAIYRIEDQAREFDPDARYAHRQQHAAPLVDAFGEWLRELHPKVLGSSGTARAIAYSLKRWPALRRYLDNGRYPIDNNPVENAIRPIAIGRRNWLFAGSEPAGKRAAAIMSLIATAKANGHDPHAWLSDVLERLPTTLDRDIDSLLPQNWKPRG
jgi:transposase